MPEVSGPSSCVLASAPAAGTMPSRTSALTEAMPRRRGLSIAGPRNGRMEREQSWDAGHIVRSVRLCNRRGEKKGQQRVSGFRRAGARRCKLDIRLHPLAVTAPSNRYYGPCMTDDHLPPDIERAHWV